jgi:hypothetical protein
MGHVFRKADITGSYPTSTFVGAANGFLSNSKSLVNRWRLPGDEVFTNVPGLAKTNSNSVEWYRNGDLNVFDAGNIRLQQITLGYTLPQTVISKLKAFRSVTANATISNLGLIWRANKEGIDPDYVVTNNYTNLPPSVNYVFNLNFSF